ncbi:MepB protein [Leptospira gomenensis]|uniref:MepB protein n=1 Tax=Leptospira gomenensis TaxID=2484974 RepID=A0A5F1YH23_9LEPT|nr:MepB family protein [Leptospira gomenensis]TGK37592.1 MepB protein [Leptospira gomenensis]TGK39400.1 MepB protein [Leptospira gomenensis]TGK43177.1 MepB protein [Leptospira gomenensis]TGK54994.1 MepB protein [Leptospira gomenensis]
MKKKRSISNAVPPNLRELNSLFWRNYALQIDDYRVEEESVEYNAAHIQVKEKRIVFRTGKITPKKKGMFVTLWKRDKNGNTIPYHKNDPIDLVIVETKKSDRIGFFIFNKKILTEKRIISNEKEGKRGFRIYPPWEKTNNAQAAKSQLWQSLYFFENQRASQEDRLRFLEFTGLKEGESTSKRL